MSPLLIRNVLDRDSPPTIVWTQLSEAGASRTGTTGQLSVRYDHVSGQVYYYGTDGGGIYSTAVFFAAISGDTITFTKLSGTGGGNGGCYSTEPDSIPDGWNNGDGADLQPWLADRHPETMNCVDTKRQHLYQWSGLACGNPAVGDGLFYRDMWRLALNATPTNDTWTQRSISTKASIYFSGSMAYADRYDVIVLHGRSGGGGGGDPETWVYGPTSTGSLSASQVACGCSAADDWARTYQPGADSPPGSYYPNLEWDPVTDRVLMFRMIGGSNPWTQTVYAYNLTAKSWAQLSVTDAPSNVLSGGHPKQAVTRITSGRWRNKFLLISCMDANGATSGSTCHLFDTVTNTFTPIVTSGPAPHGIPFGTFAENVGADGSWVVYDSGRGWFKGALQ